MDVAGLLALAALAGGAAGWFLAWSRAKAGAAVAAERLAGAVRERDSALARADQAEREARALRDEAGALRQDRARLEATLQERGQAEQDRTTLLASTSQQLRETFQALSADALRGNNQAFLEQARESLGRLTEGAQTDLAARQEAIKAIVDPLRQSLAQVGEHIRQLEKIRAEAHGQLGQQIKSVAEAQVLLQQETTRLATALAGTRSRGAWGEMQLRRVVELAGMVEHCDFDVQVALPGEGRQTPDLVVHLPGNRSIIVDAKAPLDAYLQASASEGPERTRKLADHARAVREHMKALGGKNYSERLEFSPDFVILFLPGEPFLSAALESDPMLMELGLEQGVFLTTPNTLIALLRMMAFVWRQEQAAENTREIMEMGGELYERLGKLAEHFANLRKALAASVRAFNDTLGSLETRVLPGAHKLRKLGAGSEPIAEVIPIDEELRSPAEPAPVLESVRPQSG